MKAVARDSHSRYSNSRCFFALGASSTFAQGRHPAYLHALSGFAHGSRLIYNAPMEGTYATKKRMPSMKSTEAIRRHREGCYQMTVRI